MLKSLRIKGVCLKKRRNLLHPCVWLIRPGWVKSTAILYNWIFPMRKWTPRRRVWWWSGLLSRSQLQMSSLRRFSCKYCWLKQHDLGARWQGLRALWSSSNVQKGPEAGLPPWLRHLRILTEINQEGIQSTGRTLRKVNSEVGGLPSRESFW